MVRRSTRRAAGGAHPADDDDDIPEVYREMLAEAEARETHSGNDRPVKRRKVGEGRRAAGVSVGSRASVAAAAEEEKKEEEEKENAGPIMLQTAYDSTASDESDEDLEWEEVDLVPPPSSSDGFLAASPTMGREGEGGGDGALQITLGQQEGDDAKKKNRRMMARRKPISALERKLRLDVHKVHVLCLLGHVHLRNHWCNDEEVQDFLKQMLTRQVIALLNPAEDKPQFTRSTTFVDGLNQASDAFLRRFRATMPGLRRAHWADDSQSLQAKAESIISDAEVILSKDDFRKQAKTLQGSRDFGAQLFCALLRSAGVEARLVCSLQPLPFSGTTKNMTPVKAKPQYIVVSDDHDSPTDEPSRSAAASPTPLSRVRRLGRPEFTPSRPTQTLVSSVSSPRKQDSPHPIFWVEAFNEAVQKWIPVDPLVTKSLAKPSKFEPPASDPYNSLSYVVAFEEDGSARDVTRRYAKAFNAKTRKTRVESTKHGERWWATTFGYYEKPFMEDRDELEIGELTAKSAAEPMPKNVQDFKDHPIYALERHLRRNQVIHPKRAIGQVGAGKAGSKNQGLEQVYRRADVHTLRSADGWYRLGRDIKLGEQPLKRVPISRNKAAGYNEDDEDGDDIPETPLYAEFQTELYKPPPVVQGKVPKNVYGNLDVYVPSMVPPGGIHIRRSDAAQAARILDIDYADAVTGFEFKGRHGTAVFQGIVIAVEYREALEEVLKGLENERLQAELEMKSAEALRMWKHFLLRLRIAERVKGYAVEGEADDEACANVSKADDDDDEHVEETGGGFFPESHEDTENQSRLQEQCRGSDHADTSIGADGAGGGFIPEDESLGGGFLPEDESFGGGGFIPDDEPTENAAPPEPSRSEIPITPEIPRNRRTSRYSLVVVPNDTSEVAKHSYTTLKARHAPLPEEVTEIQENAPTRSFEGSSDAPIVVDSSVGGDSNSVSLEILSRPESQAQSPAHSAEPDGKGSDDQDDEVDETSLLSEDPEDEDAIPEWMM